MNFDFFVYPIMPTLLDNERKRLHNFFENINDLFASHQVSICDINSRRFCIVIRNSYREFSIALLEETVKYIKDKNKKITWEIDSSLTYFADCEVSFYEEPFWKFVSNGDCLWISLTGSINYEQFLQLINGIRLANIHFAIDSGYVIDEKNLEAFKLIKEISQAHITYRIKDFDYEVN